jgi:hypothetical protein
VLAGTVVSQRLDRPKSSIASVGLVGIDRGVIEENLIAPGISATVGSNIRRTAGGRTWRSAPTDHGKEAGSCR